MKKSEYKDYQKSITRFFKREGINCLSIDENSSDSYFSYTSCDCCNRPLGGDRYDCCGYNPTTKKYPVGLFNLFRLLLLCRIRAT